MRVCILGRTEFDIALAKAMHSIGIPLANDPKEATLVLTRQGLGDGIVISNDRSESADMHLNYAADITNDIRDTVKWRSDVLYLGPWKKEIAKFSSITSHRVCFFTGDERWAENWCGNFNDNYRNITSIVYATSVFIAPEDSMCKRLAQFFGKNVVDGTSVEEVNRILKNPERYPVIKDLNNTIYDRLKELLLAIGGSIAIYADLCEFEKEVRIKCLE